MYRRRDKAFWGALIAGAASLASGIIGGIKKRKAQKEAAEQQEQAAIRSNILQTNQAAADSANRVLEINNTYRKQFANDIMRCGGRTKTAKCGGRKKANIGTIIDIGTGLLSAAGTVAGAVTSSPGISQSGQLLSNAVKEAGQFAEYNAMKRNQQKEQEMKEKALMQLTNNNNLSQYATNNLFPKNISVNQSNINNLINDAATMRYGGRRCKCGARIKKCGGKK